MRSSSIFLQIDSIAFLQWQSFQVLLGNCLQQNHIIRVWKKFWTCSMDALSNIFHKKMMHAMTRGVYCAWTSSRLVGLLRLKWCKIHKLARPLRQNIDNYSALNAVTEVSPSSNYKQCLFSAGSSFERACRLRLVCMDEDNHPHELDTIFRHDIASLTSSAVRILWTMSASTVVRLLLRLPKDIINPLFAYNTQ